MASQSQSQEANKESRYAHLLEPIRDLADNWNVDIAAELEDYLNEVMLALKPLIRIADDGIHCHRFPEAGMREVAMCEECNGMSCDNVLTLLVVVRRLMD